ncbi:activating signal cointegrator 1 complex subunit 2 [Nylanderia fulva]|uniref:activating signal cointegrator 1 complex subunit 2 n=1 Tax=Nylanderia fulva TaxID=613905 RepID=UPI0010FB1E05|nr:activating signal cointegrator 1 complex subunit 2 [Nylanderia fulva]XP_029169819.1 activating signal cointegrator 1 complex subunit 2 [Nylanderia fulva]
MKCYENPDCVPLEELQLNIKNDGVIVVINALNARWADDRYFLRYKVPEIYNDDGSEIMGAREYWIEVMSYIIEDLKWLLDLPFYRFWSNIVYNTSIIDSLVSFLQEAPPFYALENFPNEPGMFEALEKLRYNVLMVFARLATNKESSTEYMSRLFLGNLLYDNYIFTIPIIFDLCQLYGRENTKVIEKIIFSIFTLQPMYNDDLKKSVTCLIKAFENVERRFEDCLDHATEAVVLAERANDSIEMTLYNLEDLILYILDVSSTLSILLKSYPPVTATFHRDDFINKIISFYGNTIPEIYKKLDKLAYNDENMPKYIELKHRLDVTRVEMLSLYRIIVYEPILNIQENMIMESEIRNCIDEYLNLLMNAISEKEFIIDYHEFYPINTDLETISSLHPEIDTIKCEYILQSLYASTGDTKTVVNLSHNNANVAVAGSSTVQSSQREEHCNNVNYINNEIESTSEDPDKLMSLISNVREILCDCGPGFIQQCLKYYNYDVASVVNAVIENNLPSNLKEIDKTLPYIPPDPMEASAAVDAAIGIQRLNIFDNDEFDVMTKDIIDTSKIYMGKKQEKYKNANEMLNDKSEIKKSREIYEKYSIVDDYDDEYDDTYDSHNIRGNVPDDSTEIDARPFTMPRVLRARDKNNVSSEDENEVEDEKPVQNDQFVQNPVESRAKAEQQRQLARDGKNTRDVVGNSKGQGQNKDVTNRHKKNVYKGTQSYNRRMGSQYKKRQGMVPS